MEEEKGRNNKGILPAAILFTAEISHVVPASDMYMEHTYSDMYMEHTLLRHVHGTHYSDMHMEHTLLRHVHGTHTTETCTWNTHY